MSDFYEVSDPADAVNAAAKAWCEEVVEYACRDLWGQTWLALSTGYKNGPPCVIAVPGEFDGSLDIKRMTIPEFFEDFIQNFCVAGIVDPDHIIPDIEPVLAQFEEAIAACRARYPKPENGQ